MPFLQDSRTPDGPRCVLAIDTTAAVCSVSVRVQHAQTVSRWTDRRPLTPGQSRAVLEQVETARKALAVGGEPLPLPDLVAFGCGPGAFTGLRVACGVAQGLALGWDCPVAAIDSLTTLAWQARQEALLRNRPVGRIAVVLDVRMQEVAFAVFDPAAWLSCIGQSPSQWPTPLTDPLLCSPDAAFALLSDLAVNNTPPLLAGDAFGVYPVLQGMQASVLVEQPDAAAVAELAAIAFKLGRETDAAQAAPTYLRDKVALDRHEQESLRAARRAHAG